ncbi:MAG: sortase, partial [Anaerolineae bacterium]
MARRKKLEDLSVEELQRLLLIKRRQARQERFIRLSAEGKPVDAALLGEDESPLPEGPSAPLQADRNRIHAPQVRPLGRGGRSAAQAGPAPQPASPDKKSRGRQIRDALLLGLEVSALVGLVAVLLGSYLNLRELNDEVVEARESADYVAPPTPTPLIALARLPGGHSSPTSPGGAVPDIPPHLQEWVQPAPAVALPEQDSSPPTRIVIPKINVDATIVPGVTWEDLKKGVGHLPGSANPGERGNLYLAAHNDIFGEIFRYLDDLEPGDEYIIYAGEEKFRYVVREKRVIEPTEVSVMWPTTEPVATLQTCYPYLVDTHRLVVVGELAE